MVGKVQSKEKIFELRQKNQAEITALGVKRIGLFGSFVTGDSTMDSDIDFWRMSNMFPESLDYLRHILDETKYLASMVDGLTQAKFMQDETAKRAFVRSIEIIGETTKNVPDGLRKRYPEVE